MKICLSTIKSLHSGNVTHFDKTFFVLMTPTPTPPSCLYCSVTTCGGKMVLSVLVEKHVSKRVMVPLNGWSIYDWPLVVASAVLSSKRTLIVSSLGGWVFWWVRIAFFSHSVRFACRTRQERFTCLAKFLDCINLTCEIAPVLGWMQRFRFCCRKCITSSIEVTNK